MPLLVMWMLLLVQVAVYARDRIDLQGAARDAARAAAVAPPAEREVRAVNAARSATGLRVRVELTVSGHSLTATVQLRDHATVPMVGSLLPDLDMAAHATMPLDPP
jgi:Flp pilus assembly protein TadG